MGFLVDAPPSLKLWRASLAHGVREGAGRAHVGQTTSDVRPAPPQGNNNGNGIGRREGEVWRIPQQSLEVQGAMRMSGSHEPAPIPAPNATRQTVERLVNQYRHNADQYASDSYKEAQLRQEFIDPLFEALGWDMANKQGFAEQYKEVVHEASVKISGETKAPDYCFRIGGQRKFFLEAKKPSVHVKDDPAPAYQLRRYAWSAKLPLSILTDFEEFAVYDCRKRPKQDDEASVARVDFITYDEYLERLDDIYTIFANESILKGSFDRYVQDTRRKRGTSEVDAEFLKEIEAWREMLAKDIAKHNPALSVHDLNFAVQATIDRILFFRIAEDRGVEEYGRLRGLVNGSRLYASLCDLYHEADEKYNAGLFDFSDTGDTLCPRLTISDQALKPILSKLYYPECPYEFSVLGADILGAVYEQFLGKVIRLTPSHRAKVEEKPEVKKAGGVYYTPTYIVDYIVEHTVGEALKEAKTPNKAGKLRILDPACGSGSFLLGAYQYLLNWHLDYYSSHSPKKHTKGKEPAIVQVGEKDWRLSTFERKRILQNNIYGVDIDAQAVEVTKLNLLLKCMEGETSETVDSQLRLTHERVLPNIDDNIKCGNSLIGPDYYEGRQQRMFDEDEMRRVNAFDWQAEFEEIMAAGGFDCVIGNPPYGRVTEEVLKSYFEGSFDASEGRLDMYELFVQRGLQLCREGGLFGYIVPSPVLTNLYGRKLRHDVLLKHSIEEITNFSMDVFPDPTIHTCIIVVRRQAPTRQHVRVRKGVTAVGELEEQYDYQVAQETLGKGPNATFDIFIDPMTRSVLQKLSARAQPLGNVCFIRQCIKTGNDPVYVKRFERRPGDPWKPTLRGKSISRYATLQTDLYVQYGPWLARNWKNTSFYETPKIGIRETGRRLVATLDAEHRYFLSSLYAIYPRSDAEPHSLRYLLGLLNSTLATYVMKVVALELTRGAFTKLRTNQLARLPMRVIDFDDPADVARHDKMVGLVERILELHKRLAEAKTQRDRELLQRQINATDQEIDKLVYELYGLTEEEIAIVEGSAGGD